MGTIGKGLARLDKALRNTLLKFSVEAPNLMRRSVEASGFIEVSVEATTFAEVFG